MRIHHLSCGSLCPFGGRRFWGAEGPASFCCHCLLIEGEDGLILVDSGLGVGDMTDPRRLGLLFHWMMRPRLDVAETALKQVVGLGFRPTDLRHIVPTHLDLDHAGGLSDFPHAAVHVFAPELRAARAPTLQERARYRAAQLAKVANWAPVDIDGEDWFGFSSVRALPGTRDDVLLIPLTGHSRGHCGVAVRTGEGWLFHCGDAYFHRSEVDLRGGTTPLGLRLLEFLANVDPPARRANQERLRQLARSTTGAVRLICSHDPAELAACKEMNRRFTEQNRVNV